MKSIYTIFTLVFLFSYLSHACVGNTHTVFCGVNSSIDSDSDLITTTNTENINSFADITTSAMLMPRDNTRVANTRKFDYSFFARALKTIARWARIPLNRTVNSRIDYLATIYPNKYYDWNDRRDNYVREAGQHWNDMMARANYCPSRRNGEPDHMPNVRGWQGAKDCPICDLRLDYMCP